MVQPSKKDLRKSVKGKTKAEPAPVKALSPEVEDESDWSEEDEDEDNGGVSEKGMKRLMELVGEEDLDEYEAGVLAAQDGDDDDDEDEDDDEEDDEDVEDEDLEMDSEDGSEDEEASIAGEELDNSIFMEDADPDAIRLDDLESNASVDEDAVPMRKVTANNRPAMRILTEALKVSHFPWPETLVLQSKDKIDVDPQDDLQREMAFYKVALDQVPVARKLAAKHDILFTRPTDYYAEMVKSDEHMERIRTKLVDEAQGIKKSEAAKRQRDLKKYGKQIQVQKIKQREMEKKSFQERVQGVKRKRNEGAEIGDEFDIGIDDGDDDKPQRGGASARGRGGRGGMEKGKMPRSARDNKYSLGGSSRRDKQNTKESTMDFAGWGKDKAGGGRGGASGGRGRGGKTRGGQRPGKSRRK